MHIFDINTPGVYDISVIQPLLDKIKNDTEMKNSGIFILNLIDLNSYVNEYVCSVLLHYHAVEQHNHIASTDFDDGTKNKIYQCVINWDEMAGREAVMSIYNYAEKLNAISSNSYKVPTITENMDNNILRESRRTFKKIFPDYEALRHSVSHRAEISYTLEKIKKNSTHSGKQYNFIKGHMEENTYTTTFDGKKLTMQLSHDVTTQLKTITHNVYSSFPVLSPLLPNV